jgi:hypothetical protein
VTTVPFAFSAALCAKPAAIAVTPVRLAGALH